METLEHQTSEDTAQPDLRVVVLQSELTSEDDKTRAFSELFLEYSPEISAFLHTQFPDLSLSAEDVGSRVWTKVWLNIGNFRAESPLKSWLLAIARNEAINEFRNRRRWERLNGSLYLPGAETTIDKLTPDTSLQGEDPAILYETSSQLRSAMENLSPGLREVLELSLVGFNAREIAEKLNISTGTVGSRLFRVRQQLSYLAMSELA